MKLNRMIYFGIGLLTILAVSSCKKWISVTPKTQIENEIFFSDRQGYVEGLNGVYIKLVGTPLYGRELTFGMLDVLGRTYSISSSTNGRAGINRDLYNGLYLNAGANDLIRVSWENMYNAIANLNNLIDHLETADRSMFQAGEYEMIKGEALGLRAYLHFDLIRLFTRSYKDGGANSPGIPYVTTYSPTTTPRLTVKDAMAKVIADLKAAESILKNDLIVTGAPNTALTSTFDLRKERFNYYAVKGTLARAYHWMLDDANALKEAEDLIAVRATRMPFIALTALTAADPGKNRVFTSEHVFGVTSPLLQQNYLNYLDTSRLAQSLKITTAMKNEIYENSNTDYRVQYLVKDVSADATLAIGLRGIWYSKLIQPAASKRMPLMKITEMYYIAAECLAVLDPPKATGYLNTVRNARGLTNLGSGLSTSAILTEITKEYRKEMPCEGQMFYYYKRTNATTVPGFGGIFPAAQYVLPLPQQELDFGF